MRKFVSLFVLLPLAIVLIAFTVANRAMVVVSLDPFSPQQPALALEMPLFVLVFLSLLAGVIAGGVATWLGQGRWRKQAAPAGARLSRRGARRRPCAARPRAPGLGKARPAPTPHCPRRSRAARTDPSAHGETPCESWHRRK